MEGCIFRRILLFVAVALIAFPSHAGVGRVGGIGKVGSPVVPSNLPKKPTDKKAGKDDGKKKDTAEDSEAQEESEPVQLLVIPFSQKRIYFSRTLRSAVNTTEGSMRGTNYEIVSRIPAADRTARVNKRDNSTYDSNLNAVVQEMQNIGISGDRLHTRTEIVDGLNGQEVVVFTTAR